MQSPEELFKIAKVNSCSYGAYHEEDSKRANIQYVPKTIRDQTYVLDRYEMYV